MFRLPLSRLHPASHARMNDRNAALSRHIFTTLMHSATELLSEELTALAGFHIATARLGR